jgi:hypothetical protein
MSQSDSHTQNLPSPPAMFSRAIGVARPAAKRAVSSTVASASSLRAFSVSARSSSGGHGPPPPQIFGPGVKPGEVPGVHEQSTGLERLQHLGELEGIPVFDTAPLDSSRVGTKENPILVPSAVSNFLLPGNILLMETYHHRVSSVLLDALARLPTPMTCFGSL